MLGRSRTGYGDLVTCQTFVLEFPIVADPTRIRLVSTLLSFYVLVSIES